MAVFFPKVGFYSLASNLACRGARFELDEAQDRTHRLPDVAAGDIPFLRGLDAGLSALNTFREYCRHNLKDRQTLPRWQLEQGVTRDILPILEHMTVHKLLRYLDGQYPRPRYHSMQAVVTEYRDYLDICGKLKGIVKFLNGLIGDANKPETRRKLLDCYVDKIYVYPDKLVMTFHYSDERRELPFEETARLLNNQPAHRPIHSKA